MNGMRDFGETENVAITVIVDNRADLMLKSTDAVKRFTEEPLLAEHGFAALVDLRDASARILWDAGVTRIAFTENARRMEIDLTTIDRIALSHGHGDHFAAMTDVVRTIARRPTPREWDRETPVAAIRRWVKGRRVPIIAHPAVFRERWGIEKDGSKYGPAVAPRAEWEAAGALLVLSEEPHQLGPGCWTTGAVPRLSFEEEGTPPEMAFWEGNEFARDYLDDDQSIAINVKDKGLVVVSGCAHAGIVNTVNHAREISGVDRVWAIIGGFHLGSASYDNIQRTICEIKKHKPRMVVPTHCTGFRAIREFASQMPDQFVLGSVGTTYLF